MLPEAAAVITVLTNDYHHATAPTITSQNHLTRLLSRALHSTVIGRPEAATISTRTTPSCRCTDTSQN